MRQDPHAHISVYTLGRFHVCVDGHSVVETGAEGGKTWSLFKFLLTHRHQPVSEQVVCGALWPDPPASRARRALHHVMYCLDRKLQEGGLHEPLFVVQNEMYTLNKRVDCWIDADCFEELCRQAQNAMAGDGSGALEYMQEAVELYRGWYLAEHFYDGWAKAEQQRCHRMFRELVLSYADPLMEAGENRQAQQVCEKALALEPADDELAYRLVSAHVRDGNVGRAKEALERFAAVLRREYGIAPHGRLRQLWEDLESGSGNIHASDLNAV